MFSSMIDRLKISFSQMGAREAILIYIGGVVIVHVQNVYYHSKKYLQDYRAGKYNADTSIESDEDACIKGALYYKLTNYDVLRAFLWPVWYGIGFLLTLIPAVVLYLNPPNIKK